jgi:hypothetical protein
MAFDEIEKVLAKWRLMSSVVERFRCHDDGNGKFNALLIYA